MLISKLACGPMSREIIEAVFSHSHKYRIQLMLICSRNQVDVRNGYVFTTQQYMDYVAEMEHKYQQSDIIVCRDHCGPGFGSLDNSIESVRDTIRCDLEHEFDLIHIDLCHTSRSHEEKLRNTTELMKFALNINPNIMFEIGTDENIGVSETNVDKVVSDLRICQQITNPIFYVVQTGSLVREIYNTGIFNVDKIRTMYEALHRYGVKLKEHNADYLTTEQIAVRQGVVDAVNIAPQLGVVQTSYVLSQALIYGINIEPFIVEIINGLNWKKWMPNNFYNPYSYLRALVAGHYHFNGPAYQQLIDKLSKHIDVKMNIINEIIKVIEHYLFALE